MRRIYLTLIIMVLVLATSTSAFDGKRKGFVLGGGGGMAPTMRVAIDSPDISDALSGPALNLMTGYAWNEANLIAFMSNATFCKGRGCPPEAGEEFLISQGFAGLTYHHYFGPVGRSFYLSGGVGLQYWNFFDDDYDSPDPGTGFFLGGGYEFVRHIQVNGSYSFGKTSNEFLEFEHSQFLITVMFIAF